MPSTAQSEETIGSAHPRRPGAQLFGISFAALFLELMVIRWVPAVVPFVAYYSNLMLISSFLGLGLGAMTARRSWDLFPAFGLLLLIDVGLLVGCHHFSALPQSDSEARFFVHGSSLIGYFLLLGIFVLNTALFLPFGQKIGRLFQMQPPLRAYAFDLGGSLCGAVAFGLFSVLYFSPAIGIGIVALIYLVTARRWQRWINLPLLTIAVLIVPLAANPAAFWSPYYYVLINEKTTGDTGITQPPPDLRSMPNPPIYRVWVNNGFYQVDGSIDARRYTSDSPAGRLVLEKLIPRYMVPFTIHPGAKKVCVVGSGGGPDVEAALLCGAQSVDAVEIDPTLVDLSRRFNSSDIYDDPKVRLHINDARAFFSSADSGYDLIVFGYLDSQTLFSYANNIRLDGYVYTVQSIRKAYSLLSRDGVLSIAFYSTRPWLRDKLIGAVSAAIGKPPVVYEDDAQNCVVCASPDPAFAAGAPQTRGAFELQTPAKIAIDLPTDDWPFLYLSSRTVPGDYLCVIGILLVLATAAVAVLRFTDRTGRRSARFTAGELHFFFLGLGFLLLETRSIGDCSLYFGATWIVALIVVSGVLLMVLAANLLAMRIAEFSPLFYIPLLLSLAILYFAPRDTVLGWPLAGRLTWALLVVPLPIFFAGLIFSTTFRRAEDPAGFLGANLLGATIGGFLEYLAMAIGTRSLLLIVGAAYVASFLFVAKRKFRNPEVQPAH